MPLSEQGSLLGESVTWILKINGTSFKDNNFYIPHGGDHWKSGFVIQQEQGSHKG